MASSGRSRLTAEQVCNQVCDDTSIDESGSDIEVQVIMLSWLLVTLLCNCNHDAMTWLGQDSIADVGHKFDTSLVNKTLPSLFQHDIKPYYTHALYCNWWIHGPVLYCYCDQWACAIIWIGSARTKPRTPSHFACKVGKQTSKDRHICSKEYGPLLMSATDTN